jgi:hypothetical protein
MEHRDKLPTEASISASPPAVVYPPVQKVRFTVKDSCQDLEPLKEMLSFVTSFQGVQQQQLMVVARLRRTTTQW